MPVWGFEWGAKDKNMGPFVPKWFVGDYFFLIWRYVWFKMTTSPGTHSWAHHGQKTIAVRILGCQQGATGADGWGRQPHSPTTGWTGCYHPHEGEQLQLVHLENHRHPDSGSNICISLYTSRIIKHKDLELGATVRTPCIRFPQCLNLEWSSGSF